MYNGTPVLDVHGHVSAPVETARYVVFLMASNSPSRSPISGPQRQGRGAMNFTDEMFHAAAKEHAEYMDARSIDVQLIGPRPFTMMGWMEPHLMPSWATFTNDTIKKQVEAFPDRFVGAGFLPQISEADDLGNCIPELERCVKELGFKAIYLSPDPSGKRNTPGMNERYWFPVYAKCQELGVPIVVHGTNCLDPRIRIIPQNYQIGFVWEQFLATQLLSHGDVFERYPDLKICVCHGGGALNRFIPTDNHLAQKDLSKNLFFDTCVYDIPVLEATIKQRGLKQILFGTEAPGSGGAVRPETGKSSDDLVPIIGKMDFLSEDDKVTIMNCNPAGFCPELGVASSKAAGAR